MINQMPKRFTDRRFEIKEPAWDEEPLGLLEMMELCPPCDNPDCRDKDCGWVGLTSACHSVGGTLLTVTSGIVDSCVIDMYCRACGRIFLSCYATDVDFLPQTCHPRGGYDVSIARKTGDLTVRCHLCFAALGSAAVNEAPTGSGGYVGLERTIH